MDPQKKSQFVDHFINLLVPLTESFIRDLTPMINILKDISNLSPDTVLCTLDVSSLDTRILTLRASKL